MAGKSISITGLVLLLLVVAACSAGGGSTATTSPVSPGLKTQLLSLNDLPDGWSVDQATHNDADIGIKCLQNLSSGPQDALGHADASFVQGTDFPELEEGLGGFASVAQAKAAFLHGANGLDSCGAFSLNYHGTKITGQISRLRFPATGASQQASYQMTLTAEDISFAVVVLAFRKGNTVGEFAYFDLGSPDIDAVAALAQKAVHRVSGAPINS